MKKLVPLLLAAVLLLAACAPAAGSAAASVSTTASSSAGSSSAATYQTITPEEAQQMLQDQPDAILLDVRTQEEYDTQHIEGATLLTDSDIAEHAADVKREHVQAIVDLARANYDFVVLDLSRSLDAVTLQALDMADTIFPVLHLTLPFIRDGKRLLSIFNTLGYPPAKIKLINYDYAKYGASAERRRLIAKWEKEVQNQSR